MEGKNTAIQILSIPIKNLVRQSKLQVEKLKEIRLRIGQPVWILYERTPFYLKKNGTLGKEKDQAYIVTEMDIKETLEYASGFSMYAYEHERRQGYLTIQGGHRVGMAGKIVMEQDKVKTISDIAMLNIRLAHECIGCAKKILPYIKEQEDVVNTLILSPPGGGKTTLLRDLIRELASEQGGYTVGVVDERSELAACYKGVPQNDLGVTVDVLDGCSKAEGMRMLLRSMAPDIIAVDEIGSMEDMEAIRQVTNNGCRLLATMHGSNMEDMKKRHSVKMLMEDNIFQRFIVLDDRYHVGSIKGIYKEYGKDWV